MIPSLSESASPIGEYASVDDHPKRRRPHAAKQTRAGLRPHEYFVEAKAEGSQELCGGQGGGLTIAMLEGNGREKFRSNLHPAAARDERRRRAEL